METRTVSFEVAWHRLIELRDNLLQEIKELQAPGRLNLQYRRQPEAVRTHKAAGLKKMLENVTDMLDTAPEINRRKNGHDQAVFANRASTLLQEIP